MGTNLIDTAIADAVATGAVVGAVASAWSDRGTYTGVVGHAAPGRDMQADSLFHLASMIKAIVAVAAMQLVERGVVDLDDRAGDLVPYLRDVQVLTGFDHDDVPRFRAPARPITIRHLLTHTAGFAYEFNDETTRRYLESAPAAARGSDADSQHPLVFDPGDHFMYGVSIDWLGRVVEVASGQRLDEYLREEVFDPLRMSDTTFAPTDEQIQRIVTLHTRTADGLVATPLDLPPTNAEMFTELYSTAGDYLRFARMLLGKGSLDDVRVLAPETVELMLADQLESTTASGERRFSRGVAAELSAFMDEDSGWGLSFQIHRQGRQGRRSPGSVSWVGAHNTYFWIDPDRGLTGVFATQTEPLIGDVQMAEALERFERAVYDTFV